MELGHRYQDVNRPGTIVIGFTLTLKVNPNTSPKAAFSDSINWWNIFSKNNFKFIELNLVTMKLVSLYEREK